MENQRWSLIFISVLIFSFPTCKEEEFKFFVEFKPEDPSRVDEKGFPVPLKVDLIIEGNLFFSQKIINLSGFSLKTACVTSLKRE